MFRCNLPPALWQNGRGLLRGTAVTRVGGGGRGVEWIPNKSQHTKLALEKKILPPLLERTLKSTCYRLLFVLFFSKTPMPLTSPFDRVWSLCLLCLSLGPYLSRQLHEQKPREKPRAHEHGSIPPPTPPQRLTPTHTHKNSNSRGGTTDNPVRPVGQSLEIWRDKSAYISCQKQAEGTKEVNSVYPTTRSSSIDVWTRKVASSSDPTALVSIRHGFLTFDGDELTQARMILPSVVQ